MEACLTMSTLSQFAGGSLPVGSIVQAPYNLTDPAYLPCDGRKVLRADYPLLSACLPSIGTFTATSRTKSAAPTSSAIATNGTVWVVTGAVGTSNLYYTSDGITYNVTTTPANFDTRSILWDGTNFVAISSNGNAPVYSTTGATWTQSASGAVNCAPSSLQTCATWASSLGTVGRFCFAGGTSAFYTSDDRGVTWTTRPHGLGGSVFHVCWTGTKFIATTGTENVIYTSTDGITWVSQALSFGYPAATATTGSIISDGNGRVLMASNSKFVFTSQDHGATWTSRMFGLSSYLGCVDLSSVTVSYTNGRFFLPHDASAGGPFVSTDLIGWAMYTDVPNPTLSEDAAATFSYKSGVYLMNRNNATTEAYTLTEDTSYMKLPLGAQGITNNQVNWNNFMPFIKVR